jgi:1-aminocyclopropane-1-carboxylate deaminase/D-cysteine desulfhydrase-like pyridoxal-dependent ACC family enzyme
MSTVATLINKGVEINRINIDEATEKNISVSVLRLDQVHPLVPGNKLFKLYYFLLRALQSPSKNIITFGGAYSNHLAATAAACHENNLSCKGIVNGLEPPKLSHTLEFCRQMGMELEFVDRSRYRKLNDEASEHNLDIDDIIIPEGGFSNEGVNGAALISNYYKHQNFTHICTAVGSGTTLIGLVKGSDPSQQVMGYSAAKDTDLEKKLRSLKPVSNTNFHIIHDFHFGGFAKKNSMLIDFMNKFFELYKIPLDFVYTGKMMFGVMSMINKNYFPEHSKILCIHTGGLQGNLSLPTSTLNF